MSQAETDALPLIPSEQTVEKLFYSIGEVSDMTGVEPYVLRYWESEFKLLHPSKRSSGQRSYQKKDIETILTIKRLLYEDLYTIAGAKKKLREEKNGSSESAEVPAAVSIPVAAAPTVVEVKVKDESTLEFLKEVRADLQELQEEIRNA